MSEVQVKEEHQATTEESDVVVYRTMDYGAFSFIDRNRRIKPNLVDKIQRSVSKRNKLDKKPITVSSDMEVFDGQHRLLAAERLGVPIYFTIDEDITVDDVALLNHNVQTWTMEDFLHFYDKGGNEHYKALTEFWDRNNHLSLSYAAELLSTTTNEEGEWSQHKSLRTFREGGFKVGDADYAQVVADRILDFYELGGDVRNPKSFSRAVERISRSGDYNHPRMIEKVQQFGGLNHCTDTKSYMLHMEVVYNYNVTNRKQLF